MKKKVLMMIGAAVAGATAVKGYEVVKEYRHNKRQEELRAWARSFADDYEDEVDEKVWFDPDEEFDTDLDADWDLEPKENACCCECAVDMIDVLEDNLRRMEIILEGIREVKETTVDKTVDKTTEKTVEKLAEESEKMVAETAGKASKKGKKGNE